LCLKFLYIILFLYQKNNMFELDTTSFYLWWFLFLIIFFVYLFFFNSENQTFQEKLEIKKQCDQLWLNLATYVGNDNVYCSDN